MTDLQERRSCDCTCDQLSVAEISPLFSSTSFIRLQCVDGAHKCFIPLHCSGFNAPLNTHKQLPVPVPSLYTPSHFPPLIHLSDFTRTQGGSRTDKLPW